LAAKCDLAEACEGGRAVAASCVEVRAVQLLRMVGLAEAQRDLRLDERDVLVRRRLHSRREPLRSDVQTRRELVDHLQRGDARAGLQPRDVGGRASGERELALREPRAQARLAETLADSLR